MTNSKAWANYYNSLFCCEGHWSIFLIAFKKVSIFFFLLGTKAKGWQHHCVKKKASAWRKETWFLSPLLRSSSAFVITVEWGGVGWQCGQTNDQQPLSSHFRVLKISLCLLPPQSPNPLLAFHRATQRLEMHHLANVGGGAATTTKPNKNPDCTGAKENLWGHAGSSVHRDRQPWMPKACSPPSLGEKASQGFIKTI